MLDNLIAKFAIVCGVVAIVIAAHTGSNAPVKVAEADNGAPFAECVYMLESPTFRAPFATLHDARMSMSLLGVNPDRTPPGWDITSARIDC